MKFYGNYDSGLYVIAKEDSLAVTVRIFENNRFMQRLTGISSRRQQAEMRERGIGAGRVDLGELVKRGKKGRALNITYICLLSAYWGIPFVYFVAYEFERDGLPCACIARGFVSGDHWNKRPVNRVTAFLKSKLVPPYGIDPTNN